MRLKSSLVGGSLCRIKNKDLFQSRSGLAGKKPCIETMSQAYLGISTCWYQRDVEIEVKEPSANATKHVNAWLTENEAIEN